MIENPSSNDGRQELLATAIALGSGPEAIGLQEQRGGEQFRKSGMLPVNMGPSKQAFEDVGFTFEEPDPADPLFCRAELPEGWKITASGHHMHHDIIDTQGRKRVNIFYKASTYDRRGEMRLYDIADYVPHCILHKLPVIPDDQWATPAAIVEAASAVIERLDKRIASWREQNILSYLVDDQAERDRYAALVEQFGGDSA